MPRRILYLSSPVYITSKANGMKAIGLAISDWFCQSCVCISVSRSLKADYCHSQPQLRKEWKVNNFYKERSTCVWVILIDTNLFNMD